MDKKQTIELNKKQAEFYTTKTKNIPTRIWSFIRESTLKNVRKELGIMEDCYNTHMEWFGDLKYKKVLDLGCAYGNYHSEHLAKHSKQYFGVDLSEKAIGLLRKKIKNYPNAKALSVDFLSDDFQEVDFDLIYAHGVLHHFENVDLIITKLKEKLKYNGQIISHDPLETSLPIWILRRLYRPFQSDAMWEWPFNRKTLNKFNENFNIVEKRGILAKSKWYFLILLLPITKPAKIRLGKFLHDIDWKKSSDSFNYLYKCMQVSIHMKNN